MFKFSKSFKGVLKGHYYVVIALGNNHIEEGQLLHKDIFKAVSACKDMMEAKEPRVAVDMYIENDKHSYAIVKEQSTGEVWLLSKNVALVKRIIKFRYNYIFK